MFLREWNGTATTENFMTDIADSRISAFVCSLKELIRFYSVLSRPVLLSHLRTGLRRRMRTGTARTRQRQS